MPDEPLIPRPAVSGPSPDEVATRNFPVTRRGLDPDAVRHFLQDVATALRDAQRREADLRARLERPAEPVRSQVEVDEASLTAALGVETARVLQTAHEAARDIVTRGEKRANALIEDAESALAERTRYAEREAAETLERARREADALLEETRSRARDMIDESVEARRKILVDLAARRKALHVQLEQMRAGKDSLSHVLDGVAGSIAASVEAMRQRLDGAEEEARSAAAEAGRAAELDEPEGLSLSDLVSESSHVRESLGEQRESPGTQPVSSATEHSAVSATPAESERASTSVDAAESASIEAPEGVGEHGGIDELFARIRESRQQEVAEARAAIEAIGPPRDLEPETRSSSSASSSTAQDAGGGESAALSSTQTMVALDPESDDFQLLVRRDQLLGPAVAELGRALKRTLRLEQNDLLDALRNLRRPEDAPELVPGEPMIERVAESALRGLDAAWSTGEEFVSDTLGGASPARLLDAGSRAGEVQEASRLLAIEIVEPIRRRMDAVLASLDELGSDAQAVLGAAFREWKGSRVEGVAGDFANRIFARSTLLSARSRAARISWLVDDGDLRCPDCDDNALAGVVAAGTEFPTGHTHPPIHPGCRCVLVPVQR